MLKRLARYVSHRSRQRKFRAFMQMFSPSAELSVLDVGVADSGPNIAATWATENFFEANYPWPHRITAVGLHDFRRFSRAFPKVKCVTADGRALPFADQSFDLVFSNAVVEHVGDRADQEAFIKELCRVGKQVFITTPNLLFPIEVHTLLPLVHWLPKIPRDRIFTTLGKGHSCHVRLLSPHGFRAMFPNPVQIINNGMTLVAVTVSPEGGLA